MRFSQLRLRKTERAPNHRVLETIFVMYSDAAARINPNVKQEIECRTAGIIPRDRRTQIDLRTDRYAVGSKIALDHLAFGEQPIAIPDIAGIGHDNARQTARCGQLGPDDALNENLAQPFEAITVGRGRIAEMAASDLRGFVVQVFHMLRRCRMNVALGRVACRTQHVKQSRGRATFDR